MEPSTPVAAESPRTWDRPLVMLPALALVAAVGGRLGSFTLAANLLVLGAGAVLLWLGLIGRIVRRPAPYRLSPRALFWLVPLLMLAFVELYAFTRESTEDFPTLSDLADPLLAGYAPRAVAYFAWLTGFWGLIRR